MLRRAPSPLTLRALRAQLSAKPFTCSNCASRRTLTGRSKPHPQVIHASIPAKRRYTQVAPVTAVNARKSIPKVFKELYESLKSLGSEGANYIDPSQLQLALRGLESEDATIRIGILGIDGQNGVRRLARALVTDPLKPEAEWEHTILSRSDHRGLLIRYGEEATFDDQHPVLRTISIPSAFLLKQKLELLVYETNVASEKSVDDGETLRTLLVPSLGIPISGSGRMSSVSYPVHKTIVYGEGLTGARGIFQLVQQQSSTSGYQPVKGILNAHWQQADAKSPADTADVSLVNVSQGEAAISTLRKSVENAIDYEHGWLDSNLASAQAFCSTSSPNQSQPLKPALHSLISTILEDSSVSLLRAEASRLNAQNSTIASPAAIKALDDAITDWSENAHTELRDALTSALESHSWHKLSWWKLPWRVDDIYLILTDILQRAYLPDAEKGVIWVGGQIYQAGLLGQFVPPKEIATEPARQFLAPPTDKELLQLALPVVPGKLYNPAYPWPQQLAASRVHLMATVLPLQALAQTFLVRALSTTALGSAISGLVYVGVSTTSVFEAGAIAALAAVWSMKQLQRGWEKARGNWATGVEEEGRRVLYDMEKLVRKLVEEGDKGQKDSARVKEELSEETKVRELVEKVRQRLQEIGK